MPKADPRITPSRRALLAGIPAAAAIAAIPAAVTAEGSPDAGLIRLCAEFDTLERMSRNSFPGGAQPIEGEAEHHRLLNEISVKQSDLADRITAIVPQTLEGFRAVARSIVLWAPDMRDNSAGELGGLHGDLNSALLRGLIGEVQS